MGKISIRICAMRIQSFNLLSQSSLQQSIPEPRPQDNYMSLLLAQPPCSLQQPPSLLQQQQISIQEETSLTMQQLTHEQQPPLYVVE